MGVTLRVRRGLFWTYGCLVVFGCTPALQGGASRPAQSNPPLETPALADASGVFVTTAKALDRYCDVLAVFDFHTSADSEDKGFAELRRRAAALGADAVIGAEFEHGEGSEPSHLSGMAVRYSPPPPSYDVIGPIEVDTPGDSSDKGFSELLRRAKSLGADRVVDVSFEHGEGSVQSKLSGTAVRYRR